LGICIAVRVVIYGKFRIVASDVVELVFEVGKVKPHLDPGVNDVDFEKLLGALTDDFRMRCLQIESRAYINFPAVFVILLISLVLGIQESTLVNTIIVVVKLAVVISFLIFCFPHVKVANWIPFIPPNTGHVGAYGWTGVLAAAGIIFYAYIGFDAVSCAAQEVVKPGRDLPVGILRDLGPEAARERIIFVA
jgi:Amino acid permease